MANGPYGPGRPKRWEKGKTKLPPATPGEYRIVNRESGDIEYIGESKDLQRRLSQHTRKAPKPMPTNKSNLYDPKKHKVYYKQAKPNASTGARRGHERRKVAQHRPPWNKDGGGGGGRK